jgi:sigma-B regulation protein RsbU (phosphoserine phosphatase)
MRIRFKLLILLMFLSITPLLVMRESIRHDLLRLGEVLTERSGNVLVHKASTGLKRIADGHARVLGRERQLLEAITLLLASRIEGVLSGHEHAGHDDPFSSHEAAMEVMRASYVFPHMTGRAQLLDVDFSRVTVENAAPGSIPLDGLASILGRMKLEYPELILWVELALANGERMTYPGLDSAMRMHLRMPRRSPAELYDSLAWTPPHEDPRTRTMVFTIIAPVRDVHGVVEGNLSIMVPVAALLRRNPHVATFSGNASSFLVKAVAEPDSAAARLKVVAREQSPHAWPGHWQPPQEEEWLESPDSEQFGIMLDALRARVSGVVGMPFQGGDALWAYAPVDQSGTALLLVVPREDVVRDALAARDFVASQVAEHDRQMGYVVLAVAGLVLILSLLMSKLFTRSIRELADAVRGVAEGDLTVKAPVRSADEVGQLARAFNAMVPGLRERVAMKTALEVAQEVQQSLLPSENPDFAGADVAAASVYCDETGGDYYGFIRRVREERESLVVAVGDVSGHGFQAALMMASARAYLRSQALAGEPLDRMVAGVNRLMAEDMDGSGRFMTLFLLELCADGSISWVRAGHDPALLYDPASDRFEELVGEGLPLGAIPDAQYTLNQRPGLVPGQVLLIGTDGIWEARSPVGSMFGKERLKAVIRAHSGDDSAGLIAAVTRAVDEFRGEAAQLDDMTVAAVRIP